MRDHNFKIRLLLMMLLLLGWMMTGCTKIKPVKIEDTSSVVWSGFSHTRFDNVLRKFVNDRGLVDYRSLQDDPVDLEIYYYQITTVSPDSHPDLFESESHKLAYWINAYNAGVIKTVLNYYPIGSVLEVKNPALLFFLSDKAGFFFFQRLTFGGKTTNLYYLENQIIRNRFEDPRAHFALNCASLGCPRLPRHTFSGDLLDQQLDSEARLFLAEDRNFKINHDEKAIYLSAIFQWYEEEFTNWYRRKYPNRKANLLSFIELYLTPAKSEALDKIGDRYTLHFRPYDWRLNDQNDIQ